MALEACGGSHHWARKLTELGHDVRLILAQYVKPHVKRAKNAIGVWFMGMSEIILPRPQV